MLILLPCIYLLLFIVLISTMKFFRFEGLRKVQLVCLFLVKCMAGLAVWMVYNWYYTGSDMQVYFEGSRAMVDALLHPAIGGGFVDPPGGWNSNFDESFNSARIIILLNVPIQFISFGNIFVHILFFCFFSFSGLCAIYKAVRKFVPVKNYALVIGIFLVPSALFWTSGVGKEALAVFFLGLLISGTELGLRKDYSVWNIVQSIVCFIVLFFLKMHVALAIIPVLAINFLYVRQFIKKLWLNAVIVLLPLVLLVYCGSLVSERTNVFRLISDKQNKAISEAKGGKFLVNASNFICVDYYNDDALILQPDSSYRIAPGTDLLSWRLNNMQDTTFVKNSSDTSRYFLLYSVMPANTFLNISKMEPTFASAMKSAPFAILNVMLRPTLFGVHNSMHLLAALENAWLLLLIVLAIVCFDKESLKHKEVLLFCILFALIQYAVIGLTTPAVGAIVRYKSTALPFLVMALLLCLDRSKIRRLFDRRKQTGS